MKKYCLTILSVILIIMFSACGSSGAKTQAAASASDFSATDFKGTWCVSEVLTPAGKAVDSSTMLQMGSGFKLELIDKGVYFVYGTDGSVMGQGQYTITGNILTLTAGSVKTVYQIIDAGTLRSVSEDKSVTVMAKQPEASPAASENDAVDSDNPSDTDAPEDDIDDPDDQDAPDDSAAPDSTASPDQTPDSTGSPSAGASD
jgi:hypothetical protein